MSARRPLGFELAFVVLVSAIVLLPGIWRYTLIDPWETHYGEVAREMRQNHDWVHTEWRGTSDGKPDDNEGFRSKPVLQFWMMAASMSVLGVAEDGGYSGEMTDGPRVMLAIRLPFVLSAIAGLALVWWMLARLVSRRLAWLALLVVGSAPMFCMIARNAIPDMPMVACTMGALALFTLAVEDGERPIAPRWRLGRFALDARHVVLALAGGFVVAQAAYYAVHFAARPPLAVRGVNPALWLPPLMLLGLLAMARTGMLALRLPLLVVGGAIAAVTKDPVPARAPGQSRWRFAIDAVLVAWDRRAPDRYVLRALCWPVAWLVADGWPTTAAWADRVLRVAPLTTMRQVYLLGCYALLGVSVLAKGPPGVMVVGAVGVLHVALLGRWRALADGAFELKRGVVLALVIAVPWHVAMYLRDGLRFINEYVGQHILNRAAQGVDDSPGTFAYYTSQLGHGLWLWAALLPAALGVTFLRTRTDTRAGRVRFMVGLWAICAVAVFCFVQTKFHHYILPAIPPLALLVAFLLDDIAARRVRLHPLWAGLGAGIVVLAGRDLMFEPDRWIEMFTYLYARPWPTAEPYAIDPSDGFLALALAGAAAIALLATRWSRAGVVATCAVGLAICVFALQAYMPVAARHWGMGDALRTYYAQRTIYGEKIVYFSAAQLRADWADVRERWTFATAIPDELQAGQPMTITIELRKDGDDRVVDQSLALVGTASSIGAHTVTVTLAPGERARLDPLVARGRTAPRRARAPLYTVDADRLIGWRLYWRGENFWSGGEIWAQLPEQKTQFNNMNDNVELTRYLNDRTRAPLGRRYFVITDAGKIGSVKSLLVTPRGRDTFEVLDTTSNKFALGAFWM